MFLYFSPYPIYPTIPWVNFTKKCFNSMRQRPMRLEIRMHMDIVVWHFVFKCVRVSGRVGGLTHMRVVFVAAPLASVRSGTFAFRSCLPAGRTRDWAAPFVFFLFHLLKNVKN